MVGEPNPWLTIPLDDYEGHMSAPGVEQLVVLSELFALALAMRQPASVAVLGVAGGNGLERIDAEVTRRVAGVDCNSQYLDAVRERYANVAGLELVCADLACGEPVAAGRFALVHAALIFEHAGTGQCLENALALVDTGGALSVVLQLPSSVEQGVSATGFASIQQLRGHFAFVDRAELTRRLAERGFALVLEQRRELPGGKAFWLGLFQSP